MNSIRSKQPWLADFFLLSAIWGSSFLFMQIGLQEFGVLPTAAVRVGVASLFLLPLLLWRQLGKTLLQNWRPTFLVGLFNSAIPFACIAFALQTLSTGLSAIINATVPLFGALIAWLWLKDRLKRSQILGLLIGFAGVALLASDKASFTPKTTEIASGWAVLALLLACVCYGISASYTKLSLTKMPSLVTATGSQIGAFISLVLPALWFWPNQMPGLRAWLALLTVGIVCSGLAYILFFRLINRAGPTRALSVTFVVPIFANFYGVTLLGEVVTPRMLVMACVIICGTLLATGLVRLPGR
ncbi:MAG: EamA family transporter [Burkholderiaceae bacterium]